MSVLHDSVLTQRKGEVSVLHDSVLNPKEKERLFAQSSSSLCRENGEHSAQSCPSPMVPRVLYVHHAPLPWSLGCCMCTMPASHGPKVLYVHHASLPWS